MLHKDDYCEPPVPVPARRRSLLTLRTAAAGCLACPWASGSTQTVFGAGQRDSKVVLIGEQPGDREDVEGRPFVGPAGRLLHELLSEVGFEPGGLYFTNAVKHFKFVARGRRRIHQAPNATDINTCRPWLEAELETVAPRVVVCLGATAARSILGPAFRITKERGVVTPTVWCERTLATYHPSAVLRMPDMAAAASARADMIRDLSTARKLAGA